MKAAAMALLIFANTVCAFTQIPYELLGFNTCSVNGKDLYYVYEGKSMGNLGLHFADGVPVCPRGIGTYPLDIIVNSYTPRYRENAVGHSYFAGAVADIGIEYEFAGNTLIYWANSHDFEPSEAETQIRQNNNDISITLKYESGITTIRYYNSPEEKLRDIYYKDLLRCFYWWFDYVNSDLYESELNYRIRNNLQDEIPSYHEVIDRLSGEELRIFRNCLYAKHQYIFINDKWKLFFKKYDEYYQGDNTSREAEKLFSDHERILLNAIIDREGKSGSSNSR